MQDVMKLHRRDFLKTTGAASLGALPAFGQARVRLPQPAARAVTWAADHLQRAISEKGIGGRPVTFTVSKTAGASESLSFSRSSDSINISASDDRGMIYAMLELADRVHHGSPLDFPKPLNERPANAV